MATVDTSLYAQFGVRPKSMAEFARERDEAETNRLALLINKEKYGDMQRQRERGNALQSLMSSIPADATPEQRMNTLRTGGFHAEADDLYKATLANRKTQADIAKDEADARAKQLTMARDRMGIVLQAISSAKDQGSYDQARMFLQAQGFDVSDIPPQFNPAYVQNAGQQALTAMQRIEAGLKEREFSLKANNELIGTDGQVNQQLLGAKQSVARAGASNVQINTGQKGLDNEFKLRGEFKSEPVYKAHQEMTAAYNQIKQSLGQATPAGDLAGATKIMKLLDPGSVVRESELGMAMQASGLMDRLTNYAQMTISGQKLTPQQRKDFQALADSLYSESVKQYNAKRDEYQRLGGEYGLNADRALGRGVDAPKQAAPQQSEKVRRFNPATGKIE